MPSTADRREPTPRPVLLARRQILVGLAGIPLTLTLAACTAREGEPDPTGSTSGTDGGAASPPPETEAPPPDTPALETAASDALVLIATYEATIAIHPALGPALAPYAADHDAHLEALAERITLPPSAGPPPTDSTPPAAASTTPATEGPTVTAPPVPADAAAARVAIGQAEELTGAAVRDAARRAHDGEAARLLASIGASRAVHALLLGAPA